MFNKLKYLFKEKPAISIFRLNQNIINYITDTYGPYHGPYSNITPLQQFLANEPYATKLVYRDEQFRDDTIPRRFIEFQNEGDKLQFILRWGE